jgi:hypothetical protein
VKFVLANDTLRATLYRLSNAQPGIWEAKDRFVVRPK